MRHWCVSFWVLAALWYGDRYGSIVTNCGNGRIGRMARITLADETTCASYFRPIRRSLGFYTLEL